MAQEKIRKALFAGSFYPKEKKELQNQIDNLLSSCAQNTQKNTSSKNSAQSSSKSAKNKSHFQKSSKNSLRALIVPHAGYIYSGPTAAVAYNELKKYSPKKIILTGPAHSDYIIEAAGFEGSWETPLGKVKVSKHSLPVISVDGEHSLEVQVPFLQSVLKKFEFVPIIYGYISPKELAQIIKKELSKDTVIIASSDLSHYNPYSKAVEVDSRSIQSIISLDEDEFAKVGDACGKIGISAIINIAKERNWKAVLLDYKNSGDTTGDKDAVVGYCAIAFFEVKKNGKEKNSK